MITLRAATAEHSSDLLRLLEDNAMQGAVEMVMTRRPDYFANQHYFGTEYPLLAQDGERALGMSQLTKHQGFVNGQVTELGYLNSLRIGSHDRNRIRILKAGYNYIRQHLAPPEHCYTSIASDNKTARSLLEKGNIGLPKYHLLGELSTLAICSKRGRRSNLWLRVALEEYPQIVDFYHQQVAGYQLSPRLSVDWLRQTELPVLGYYRNGQLCGCAVIWNQQRFKQVIAVGYSLVARILKPFYNGYAGLTHRVRLPAINCTLDQSFLAFFAASDKNDIIPLIDDALTHCPSSVMTLGMGADHPLLAKVTQRFSPLIYQTCLYGVELSQGAHWDQRAISPEAAIL